MKQSIQLYINDRLLDLKDDFNILMNYKVEDVTNPTAVKNNFSKTVTVEGTNNNNLIFNNFWNVQSTGRGLYEYDLTRKNDFKLFYNNELLETGYCKLDSIDNKRNLITYNLTLYGGIGDFFYNLAFDDKGNKRKLKDLDYGGGEGEFSFNVTAQVVKNAWIALTQPSYNTLYDKINFAPCNNGIPNDFDTKKVLMRAKNNPYGLETFPDTPSSDTGYIMAEIQGDREYNEWATRDFRAYNQRPILRMKYFINAICDSRNNGGYEVELDNTFFNNKNPYYEKSWMTLPLLGETDGVDTSSKEPVYFVATSFNDKNTAVTMELPTTTTIQGNKGNVSVVYDLSFMTREGLEEMYTSYPSSRYDPKPGEREGYYAGAYCIQLVAKKSDGTPVYNSEVQVLTSNLCGQPLYQMGIRGFMPSAYNYIYGQFKREEGTNRYSWGAQEITINNMELFNNMIFELRIQKIWKTNTNFDLDCNTVFKPVAGIIVNPVQKAAVKVDAKIGMGVLEDKESRLEQATPIKIRMTKARILNSKESPLDYLLGYTKQFGLYFIKDVTRKKINIVTRNTFYSKYSDIMDIENKIDYDTVKITPLAFDKKWYDFKLEMEKTKYSEQYKTSHPTEFGVMRVNTNYEYDQSTKNLLEKNPYKSAVMVRDNNPYNVNYFESITITGGKLPVIKRVEVSPIFLDGAKFFHYTSNYDTEEYKDKDLAPDKGTRYAALYSERGYNYLPLLNFADKDGKGVDGSNVLIFYNGIQPIYDHNGKIIYAKLSDDPEELEKLNGGRACWVYDDLGIDVPGMPIFGRYYVGDEKSVQYSFNMANPAETYTYDYSMSESSSIYARFWQNFIRDQYDKNTRVLECRVNLERRVMLDYLQRVFFFMGSYWVLLEVSDYDLCRFNTTKCKFIKIQSPRNYNSGQILN